MTLNFLLQTCCILPQNEYSTTEWKLIISDVEYFISFPMGTTQPMQCNAIQCMCDVSVGLSTFCNAVSCANLMFQWRTLHFKGSNISANLFYVWENVFRIWNPMGDIIRELSNLVQLHSVSATNHSASSGLNGAKGKSKCILTRI